MKRSPRLLVDVRDDGNIRGFHVLASLYLIADQLRPVDLYRVGGDAPDENIACRAFSFDTGLEFRRIWRLILVDSKFDLYVSAANALPEDAPSIAARQTSRRTIIALMFGQPEARSALDAIVVNGHDTVHLAQMVMEELRLSAQAEKE
jgi:hypothetical protein